MERAAIKNKLYIENIVNQSLRGMILHSSKVFSNENTMHSLNSKNTVGCLYFIEY